MPVNLFYRTPLGIARITDDDGYISAISIRDEEGLEVNEPETALLKTVAIQFDEYFAGERKDFDLPIKQAGTEFQHKVWQQLLQIPYGTTTSYATLSNQMKNPLAIRAIASANGKNNLWIVVPCHRVIGSDGSLTGYAGGLWRKQWLLEHEARIAGTGQTKLFF
ncbi:methylated-DNA--[protein]-cysteine S-methyltransferase [Mucilaginibacter sp. UR6-1]|uniref:methylated-DNA--[protein]-cysteine S-methyltransferase n=1 Tax=Mucilaginibacter sp. UR6-1 TaxID=1435643 RepID=UPI001E469012|nr:methylated-DNA--[protein]-cysteine S-methyltransferase [Mucilaginibacter sp. UR6-1]MCC8410180.1 methylated-DNA--[protein]-cysteine S-methyltransferase [Mucilaginibacter sp. UR6-1]